MIDTKESMTAKICSFVRAYHSYFSRDKVFDDYLAYDFMGKDEYDEIKELVKEEFGLYRLDPKGASADSRIYTLLNELVAPIPLARISFAEKELADFVSKNSVCQYVICGAGMDTFAFRNSNPNIRIFELDHPDTQRYKLQKISELEWSVPGNVSYVPVDFSCDELSAALVGAGFDERMPTFFSILGVTYYLTLPVLEKTIADISSSVSSAAAVVFDYPDLTTLSADAPERVRLMTQTTARLGEPMCQGYDFEILAQMLGKRDFKVKKHLDPSLIQAEFFTGRTDGLRAFENVHLLIAEKI